MRKHSSMQSYRFIAQISLRCLLFLLPLGLFAQEKTHRFRLFQRENERNEIVKVNTFSNEVVLFEINDNNPELLNLIFFQNDTIIMDTMENISISYVYEVNDTAFTHTTHPIFLADQLFYTTDSLFARFSEGIVLFTRRNNHFSLENTFVFDTGVSAPGIKISLLSSLVGYKNGKLILGKQHFEDDSCKSCYALAVYDLSKQKLETVKRFDLGNNIMMHYNESYRAFACSENQIAFMDPIKPIVRLFDYHLEPIDSIDFAMNDEYRHTQYLLDTNVSLNKEVIHPNQPKVTMMLLEQIGVWRNSGNLKLQFMNDHNLLILARRQGGDSFDMIKINTKTKEKEVILSFSTNDTASPYRSLVWSSSFRIFNNGIFFNAPAELSEDEEHIDYYLEIFYSEWFDFSNKLALEDHKGKVSDVDLTRYKYVIVFDKYLCKNCFSKTLQDANLLFIYASQASKTTRVSLRNELRKIYPNAEILFNHGHKFKVKKNILLESNTRLVQ